MRNNNCFNSYFCKSSGRRITSAIEMREVEREMALRGNIVLDASEIGSYFKQSKKEANEYKSICDKKKIRKLLTNKGFI